MSVPTGLGVGVGKFRQIWARVVKDGQFWMGQTDQAGMDDISSVCVCVDVPEGLRVGMDGCGQFWADIGNMSFQRHCFTALVNCCRHLYME